MTPKRRNYWDSETFPLAVNRHVVGKLVKGKGPYELTMPMSERAPLEVEARKEAPPRHCLTCGKVLVKRVRVQIDRPTDKVVMGSVEYGYRGKGYWDTLRCMRESAPKLAAALIRIQGPLEVGVDTRAIRFLSQIAQKALNHFHHHFGRPA